jgi:hypothetical protein
LCGQWPNQRMQGCTRIHCYRDPPNSTAPLIASYTFKLAVAAPNKISKSRAPGASQDTRGLPSAARASYLHMLLHHDHRHPRNYRTYHGAAAWVQLPAPLQLSLLPLLLWRAAIAAAPPQPCLPPLHLIVTIHQQLRAAMAEQLSRCSMLQLTRCCLPAHSKESLQPCFRHGSGQQNLDTGVQETQRKKAPPRAFAV